MSADNSQNGNFLKHLQDPGTFTISLQIDPRSDATSHPFQHVLDEIRRCADVAAVDINSPSSRPAQDALLLACSAQQRGIIGIPHLTCRDASFGSILNQILAAVAHFGLENVLAITGDRPKAQFPQCGDGVFQGDAVQLVTELDRLRHGMHLSGQASPRVRFAIGVAFDYAASDMARERDRLAAKRAASANFVMSQPIFTMQQAEALLEAAHGVWDRPIMPGIWPLQSREQAIRLNSTVPGIVVPEKIIAQMPSKTEGAEHAEGVGRELSRLLLRRLRDEHLFAGAYIIAPNRDPWRALKMLNGS